MKWHGIKHYSNILLHGSSLGAGIEKPLVSHTGEGSTPTTNKNYEGMNPYYRWFRQDEIVNRCIVTNAYFAAMTAGFETELEANDPTGEMTKEQKEAIVKEYGYVKEFVDKINKQVNMDRVIFVSQIKRSIFRHAAWEIVYNADAQTPEWLLSLQSTRVKPSVNSEWQIDGFKWDNVKMWNDPEDILYFPNLDLENDHFGLSDVEPVVDPCMARHNLLRVDFPEIAHRLWAPYVILNADTSGIETETKKRAFMQNLLNACRSGKSTVINNSVTATVVNMNINIAGLVQMLEKLEEAILRQFGTPRFLVNKPIENRATAYAELEAYVGGKIAFIQKFFKRELEAQWYDRLTQIALFDHGVNMPENPPVTVKHVWNPIRTTDVYAMAQAVANLHQTGLGILADYEDIAFEMMGWDKERLKEKQEQEKKRLDEMLNREPTQT